MRRALLRGGIICILAALTGTAGAQPARVLAQKSLDAALAGLAPQRPGIVDAYVIVVALNSDPVFNREAREAGKVLSRRFDASGRTVVLAASEGASRADAPGTPKGLHNALKHVASVMDRNEDVLVVYSTSHGGAERGLLYQPDGGKITATITPSGFAREVGKLGFRNRLFILQACYSGQFVPALASPGTIVITAASADRSSFGCTPGNDWTFFGHALINQAMRGPAVLPQQFARAAGIIRGWEIEAGLTPSNPQISIGSDALRWLNVLERRAPRQATAPVGRPPSEVLE